ncbi:MAG: hypothetical protein WBA97_00785 [Actinophytocola sp.]
MTSRLTGFPDVTDDQWLHVTTLNPPTALCALTDWLPAMIAAWHGTVVTR